MVDIAEINARVHDQSRFVTALRDEVGKVIIMVLMFIGRVGPLTLILLLSDRRGASAPRYPIEEIETA